MRWAKIRKKYKEVIISDVLVNFYLTGEKIKDLIYSVCWFPWWGKALWTKSALMTLHEQSQTNVFLLDSLYLWGIWGIGSQFVRKKYLYTEGMINNSRNYFLFFLLLPTWIFFISGAYLFEWLISLIHFFDRDLSKRHF